MSDKYTERAREILQQATGFPVGPMRPQVVNTIARALEQTDLKARIDEREMPMPYRYSVQHRLAELRARLSELMEGKDAKRTG